MENRSLIFILIKGGRPGEGGGVVVQGGNQCGHAGSG